MKIKHIYITKEGEPMANPEMEYPTLYFISGGHEVARTDLDEALAKYHSGLLPFEDREEVKDELFHQITGGPQVDVPFNVMFKPDTLIPVDLEVEVVEQKIAAHENSDKSWGPVVLEGHKLFQYRKVLRIKN